MKTFTPTHSRQPGPADYHPAGPVAPGGNYNCVGISTASTGSVIGCSFLDVQKGVAHALPAGGSGLRLSQNFFGGCGIGYLVFNPANASITASNSGTVTQDCNTFARLSGQLVETPPASTTSQYYGIYVDYNAHAKIVDNGFGNPLTNKFYDNGKGASAFQAIYSANVNAGNVDYYTFSNYVTQITPLIGPNVNLQPSGTNYDPNPQNVCAPTGPNGLSRSANASITSTTQLPRLEQSVPNPAHGTTYIEYQLPTGRYATLVLRRALDGREVAVLPLDAKATSCEVDLSLYPAGTYFYTLTTDSGEAITRRLVIQ